MNNLSIVGTNANEAIKAKIVARIRRHFDARKLGTNNVTYAVMDCARRLSWRGQRRTSGSPVDLLRLTTAWFCAVYSRRYTRCPE